MAQVIRKFNPGGVVDMAPFTYNGEKYDLGDAVATWNHNLEKHISNLGLDQKDANTFRKIYSEYVDGLQKGKLSIGANALEHDAADNFTSNTGEYKKPTKFLGITLKGLSDEQRTSNMSQEVVHYMLQSIRENVVPKYENKPIFGIDLNKEISDSQYGGKQLDNEFFNLWNSYDELDRTTGKRNTSGRANVLYGILSDVINRVENDPSYRRKFSYAGDDTDWDNAWRNSIQKYRQAIELLNDNDISASDKRQLAQLGITGLDRFLATDDKELQKQLEEEAKKTKEEKMKLNPNGFKSRDIFDITSPVQFYWDGELVEDLKEAMQKNPDIKAAYDKAIQDQFAQQIPDYDYEWKSWRDNGYNYARNLSPYFNMPSGYSGLYAIRKGPLDPSTTVFVAQNENGDFIQGNISQTNEGIYTFTPNNGAQEVNLGIRRGGVNGQDAVQWNTLDDWTINQMTPEIMSEYFDTYANRTSKKDIYKLAKHIQEWSKLGFRENPMHGKVLMYDGEPAVSVKEGTDGKHYLEIIVPNKGTIKYEIKDGSQYKTDVNGNKYITADQIARIVTTRNGVKKAQAGTTITLRAPESSTTVSAPIEYQDVPVSSAPIHASLSSEENKMQEYLSQKELDTNDYIRLGAAMADVVSAAGAFIPGAHLASAGVGVGSTLAHAAADFTDEDVGFWEALGTAGLNLGMDAVSLLPYGKLAKAGKAMKIIANYVPHIAGTIQTYNLISNPELQKSMGVTLHKINQMDLTKLNTQDFNNIAYLARTFLGLKSGVKQVKGAVGKSTGKSDIEGEVKVGDKKYTVKTEVDNDDVKLFSRNKKLGEDAIKQSDQLRTKVAKDVDAEFKAKAKDDAEFKYTQKDIDAEVAKRIEGIDEVKVRTKFGRLDTTSQPRVRQDNKQVPRKLLQDTWFSKEGIDWKYSDYNLARSQSPLVKYFTQQFEDTVPYSEKREMATKRSEPARAAKEAEIKAKEAKKAEAEAEARAKVKAQKKRDLETALLGNRIYRQLGYQGTFTNAKSDWIEVHKVIRQSKILSKDQKKSLLKNTKRDVRNQLDRIDEMLKQISKNTKKPAKKEQGGVLVQYFQNSGTINNITHSNKRKSWKTSVFDKYWDDILSGLQNASNKDAFVNAINDMQEKHSKLYKNYVDSNKAIVTKDNEVAAYQNAIKDGYNYVNTKGISNANVLGEYTTKAKKQTSGDNSASNWTADGLYGAQTDDRRLLGRRWDFDDQEIIDMNKSLAQHGYEMSLDDNTGYYKLNKKASTTPATAPTTEAAQVKAPAAESAGTTTAASPVSTTPAVQKTTQTVTTSVQKAPEEEYKKNDTGDKTQIGENTGVGNKSKGHWLLNAPAILGAIDLATALFGSQREEDAAKKAASVVAPSQAVRHDKKVYGNYSAVAATEKDKANREYLANLAQVSVPELMMAHRKEISTANDAVMEKAREADSQMYHTTSEAADAQSRANKEAEVTNANAMSQKVAASEAAQKQVEATATADRVKSISNFIKELRTQAMQKAAAENEVNTKVALHQYKTNYATQSAELKDKYNKEWQESDDKDKYITLDEYIKGDINRYNKYIKEMGKLQNDLYTTHFTGLLDKNYSFAPIQWEEDLFSDNIYEQYASKRKKQGGKLTASEKIKIQKIKDFNAARKAETKESMKSIRDAQNNFNKMSQTMAAGTLKLIELALGKK